MEDIGLDYSLYLHEMYISCCLKRASHVARDVHLMQMDYRVEDGRGISCSRAEGEELVSDQGFDELPAEVRTHHTFHYCAQQESKQRAHETGRNLVCRLLLEKKKTAMSGIGLSRLGFYRCFGDERYFAK